MSSHREAPEISKDPVADSTDLYAFVSPASTEAGTVTLIANYVPLEAPSGGPNFFEFGDDVLYDILIDNDGDGAPEVIYRFEFETEITNPNTFLYNTGQITSLTSSTWNRRQFYTVTRIGPHGEETVLGAHLACPPCNVGLRSIPNYASLAQAAIHNLPGDRKVFAGQRREGFYVDLGSIFDLAALRPIQSLHLIPMAATMGVDATKDLNVHSIALQVPIHDLTADGSTPTDPTNPKSVIGVYTAAYRRKARVRDTDHDTSTGPWVQVSRLGNPLFNEVIVPMARKDFWNSTQPIQDNLFEKYVQHPELAGLLVALYPDKFPNLEAFNASGASRADLVAILLTGIPNGVVPGFPGNFTGTPPADLLRLNLAIKPATSPQTHGLLAGDIAGFPNGRRVADDVVAIELQCIAGAVLGLVTKFTADAAVPAVNQFQQPFNPDATPDPTDGSRYLNVFPYLGQPKDGFDTPSS